MNVFTGRLTRKPLFIFLVLFVLNSCSQTPPRIAYLNPSDFKSEGYLDESTYQIVENGIFFNYTLAFLQRNSQLPLPVSDILDVNQIEELNENPAKLASLFKPEELCRISQIQEYNFPVITQDTENPEMDKLFQDEKIKAVLKAKESLYDKACLAARARSLYKWFIKISGKSIYGDSFENLELAEKNTKVPENVTTNFPLLDNFESNLFPPDYWFRSHTREQISRLEERLKKEDIRYEVIEETKIYSSYIGCKVVVHFHHPRLTRDFKVVKN